MKKANNIQNIVELFETALLPLQNIKNTYDKFLTYNITDFKLDNDVSLIDLEKAKIEIKNILTNLTHLSQHSQTINNDFDLLEQLNIKYTNVNNVQIPNNMQANLKFNPNFL